MQLKTILNRVHPLKSFVYEQARMIDTGKELVSVLFFNRNPGVTSVFNLRTSN